MPINAFSANEEGIVPPPNPNPPSAAENAERGEKLMTAIRHRQEADGRHLAAELARIYEVAAPVLADDACWMEAIKCWSSQAPDVPVNPRTRTDTVCKFMIGPNDPKAATKTWKRANRRSHVLKELAFRRVPVDKAHDHLTTVETPERLIRAYQERKRGRPHGAVPGTAQGATLTGHPLLVKVAATANDVMASGASTPRPLNAVKQPSTGDGPAVIEILGEAEPEPAKPQPKPALPPGYMRVELIGKREHFAALAKVKGKLVPVQLRYERQANGEHSFTLLAVGEPGGSSAPTPAAAVTRSQAPPAARPPGRPAAHPNPHTMAARQPGAKAPPPSRGPNPAAKASQPHTGPNGVVRPGGAAPLRPGRPGRPVR